MTIVKITSLYILYLLYFVSVSQADFELTKLRLQALKPKGFRVFLPDDSRVTLFLFDGLIRESSEKLWGYGVKKDLGWIYEDLHVPLKIGQSISYQVFVTIGNPLIKRKAPGDANSTIDGYTTDTKIFNVVALEDPKAHGPHCPETATKVRGGQACSKHVIFEDLFDSFREELWQIEQYIPIEHPEHPFVSYQRLTTDPTVFVNNGTLQIQPKLQEDLLKFKNQSILSGYLDLTSGCTERICSMQAVGVDILPPIVSGRVTSARFAFTYGTITVRAKMPQGDWIYPEILLEPLAKKYGALNYASGVLKVAMARGNMEPNSDRYGNKLLAGGPIINAKCRSSLDFYHKMKEDGFWGDDFHVYTLVWAPDLIALSVDGKGYGTYNPGPGGLRSWLPSACRGPWFELLESGDLMAPFDDHFYITLGLAVGGIVEFPDGLTAADVPKPWRNRGRKASYSFWQGRDAWYPTWTQPGLIVDYIKVTAL